ncbi:MAG: SDR family NAD(P)-dependent oxidoreductase [Acidimicrobiia bacterium]
MDLDLGLAGRHLFLTGAGGLGRDLTALALAAGMKVTLVDRDEAALAAPPSQDDLHTIAADLSDLRVHAELIAEAGERFGPISAFVPTAAVIRRQHELSEITEADWDFQIAVNQKAVYFLTRDVAEHMKAHGGGAIVLIASAAGVTGGIAGTTVYGAAKGAVLTMMHGFARLFAAHNVRINGVVPGSMDTPMLWVGQQPEAAANVAAICGMNRVGTPEEIAKPVLFLLSDWASYITGHALDVDGGWLYR